jgi:hypothetical protein
MPRKAQFVLPTVDTCHWRERENGAANCRLAAALLGDSYFTVSEEACAACCRSFPPSPRQLNPVVASLLFAAASRIVEGDESETRSKAHARTVRDLAERSLNTSHSAELTLTPAREQASCCWLGERLPGGSGESRDDEPARANEAIYACRHPSHATTTQSGCRMCRDWSKRRPVSRLLHLDELAPPPVRRCGPSVKKWAVGVTTAPRRSPTLEACLDTIVRAGWEEPRLFLDGTTRLPSRYAHLPVTWREDSVGAWPAWYLALAELVLHHPEADAFVLLQDDVALFDREVLRDYLERALWPGQRPGLVSLFYTGMDSVNGWHEARGGWHFSAQGLIFSPGTARAFLSDAGVSQAWLAAAGGRHVPIPEAVAEWVGRRGIEVWYANPSLSQHIGNSSTIWTNAGIGGGRRAPWFAGSVETEFAAEESLADFPEAAFTCDEPISPDYSQRVERGRSRMRESSAVICGLCRDVRIHLPRTAARIERLGQMFRDYRVVLFENDSLDATREFLADWQSQNPKVDVLSETANAPKFSQSRSLDRAAWLADCRNRYRQRIAERFPDFDYVIVVDTDLSGGWSYEGVAHSFGHDDWDFIGSYGLAPRLDPELKEFPYVHFDVWAFHPAPSTAPRKLVNHNELLLRRGEPLLPVESCFGGLGLYRMAAMRAVEYSGGDCEHVVFHQRLRRAGFNRLYMNPSQLVLYSPV